MLLRCMQEAPAWDNSARGQRRGFPDGLGGSGRGAAQQQQESLLDLKQRVMARLQQVGPSLYIIIYNYIYIPTCTLLTE